MIGRLASLRREQLRARTSNLAKRNKNLHCAGNRKRVDQKLLGLPVATDGFTRMNNDGLWPSKMEVTDCTGVSDCDFE